jgi:hypothetical protein
MERPKVKKPATLPNGLPIDPLVALDDPAEMEAEDRAPETARPNYEPDMFARDVESAEERMTQPPAPTYDMLRDSCKTSIAADVALDEEAILVPSSARVKIRHSP